MDRRFQAALGMVCFGLIAADVGATDMAVSAKLGTLGLGVEGSFGLTEKFNARLGLNKYDFDRSETIDDINYDLNLEWQSISMLADWHPFGNAFRFTAGLMLNNNELNGSAAATTLDIGSGTYLNVGLDATLDFDTTAPYLGVGWGNALAADRGWGFNVDVGIMYQGAGDVTLTPTGSGAGLVSASDIAAEEQRFENDIKDFKYYPVFSFGVSYKF